jgi:hypothetical protein
VDPLTNDPFPPLALPFLPLPLLLLMTSTDVLFSSPLSCLRRSLFAARRDWEMIELGRVNGLWEGCEMRVGGLGGLEGRTLGGGATVERRGEVEEELIVVEGMAEGVVDACV